jgi:hypothetical protein
MEKESEYGKKGVNLSHSSVWIQLRTTLLDNVFIVLVTIFTYNIDIVSLFAFSRRYNQLITPNVGRRDHPFTP